MSIPPRTLSELRAGFTSPTRGSRPMMRWWWFGPAVARADIDRDLRAMKDAGIGGVELSVVYPLSERTDRFMSTTFLDDVHYAATQAAHLDMRFDLTLGSGWSFGGPDVSPENAARRLWWDRREVGTPAFSFTPDPTWPGDELVAVFIGDGSLQEPPDEYELIRPIDGRIRVPQGRGPRVVLIATSRFTGQQVKRAAAGAEGPVFDHYSVEAVSEHIAAVCDRLLDAVSPELVGSVFCDSLEAYAADWSPRVLEEFRRRRGYDALPHLHHLHTRAESGAGVRADYYQTLTELYEENFVIPLQQWAQRRGVPLRLQGYGEPPAGISSFRHVDRFEGEGWGWKDLTQSRWATSAGHLYDHRVISSEIWTWNHSPSFRSTPMDLKGELHEHALIGVNHFIGHGWPLNPATSASGSGLGRVLYASAALDDRNPWWAAMPSLTEYTHRLAWVMRQGTPMIDVALYTGTRAAHSAMFSDVESSLNLWESSRAIVGDALPTALREAGYDFDGWDDDAVDIALSRYSAIILPDIDIFPETVRAALHAATAAGKTVVAVGRSAAHLPDAHAVADADEAIRVLDEAIRRPLQTTRPEPTLGITRRRIGAIELVLVANTGATTITTTLHPRARAAHAELWSLSDAATHVLQMENGIPLRLEPYEAAILVLHDEDPAADDSSTSTTADDTLAEALPLPTWQVSFPGDPAQSATLPHRWEDIPGRDGFSGIVQYACTIDIPHDSPLLAGDSVLDFGETTPISAGYAGTEGIRGRSFRVGVRPPIGEIAEVHVNGVTVGVVWGTPYRIRVGEHLRAGANTLTLNVANTNGNRLANDPTVVADAVRTREWYGRRFTMQDFDLAADGVASGLMSVPILRSSRS